MIIAPEIVMVVKPEIDPNAEFWAGSEIGVGDFEDADFEVGVVPDETPVVLASTPGSPSLYRIQIAPAGTLAPLNIKVPIDPPASPSPVYATVISTVLAILDVHNVLSPPSEFTARLVFALNPS